MLDIFRYIKYIRYILSFSAHFYSRLQVIGYHNAIFLSLLFVDISGKGRDQTRTLTNRPGSGPQSVVVSLLMLHIRLLPNL